MKRLLAPLMIFHLLAFGSFLLWGCSRAPGIYTMAPEKIEQIQSGADGAGADRIGVAVSSFQAELAFAKPAKGPAGGAWRGMILGASTSVAIGILAPVPGGTVVGILFSPVGALIGMVYGLLAAAPAQDIEAAEAAITTAIADLQRERPETALQQAVVRQGNDRVRRKFVALSRSEPRNTDDAADSEWVGIDGGGVGTVVEISLEKMGLLGLFVVRSVSNALINPRSAPFVQIGLRMIDVANRRVLIDDTLFCLADERDFRKWSENDGRYFYDAVRSCIPRVAEKIIDDYFLLFPFPVK